VEASALGNLSAQMIALGVLKDLNEARALICSSFEMQEYQPRTAVPAHVLECFDGLLVVREAKGEPCA